MVFFSTVQSNNAPSEDQVDDESDLGDQKNPDEFYGGIDKGLEYVL